MRKQTGFEHQGGREARGSTPPPSATNTHENELLQAMLELIDLVQYDYEEDHDVAERHKHTKCSWIEHHMKRYSNGNPNWSEEKDLKGVAGIMEQLGEAMDKFL